MVQRSNDGVAGMVDLLIQTTLKSVASEPAVATLLDVSIKRCPQTKNLNECQKKPRRKLQEHMLIAKQRKQEMKHKREKHQKDVYNQVEEKHT